MDPTKVFIYKLEKMLNEKYLHINFKFHISRRRRNVHMCLKKALLSYPEHAQIFIDIEKFWRRNSNDFELVKPPILIRTVQWKFDCIVFQKKYLSRSNVTRRVRGRR